MATVSAQLKNYRQSPRKVRLVADLVRGKNANEAIVKMRFLAKRAGSPIEKLIASAIANATNAGYDAESLVVKEIRVDQGLVMKRWMPRARGRAFPIHKRTSHVSVVLDAKEAKKETTTKAAKKPAKAKAAKK